MSALPAEDERTIFQPEASQPPASDDAGPPRPARSGLPPGTLLNNIYEVRRFLARGGMGEVYEGVNVNTDERVAIKVMLPHLAADPKVQAMFRKEARILTELAHPALVRYRVLAHEPRLELFYIVTEFIDGRSLSDLLGELRPSVFELRALMRRLAEGLAVAHAMGAVHRDMSPDNVLLPQGRLGEAKIIDFGIARETSLSHQTVVGDGFAGKLGYVAPEQFGDFGRRIGPWTDIYSLGLVGLALASERAPDMGVTLVEAVDRRREGVDLSLLPASLRPVFRKMLAPDPSHRYQTMGEVIAALDALEPDTSAPRKTSAAREAPADSGEATKSRSLKPWLIGGAGLAVIAGVALALSLNSPPKQKAGPLESIVPIGPAAVDPSIPEAVPVAAEAEAAGALQVAPTLPVEGAPVLPAPVAPKPKSSAAAERARAAASLAPAAPIAAPQIYVPPPVAIPEPAVRAAAPEPAAAPAAQAGVEACWRAVGGAWSYIGYASRGSCTAQVFNTCSVVHGRWGKTQLRRYDGKLQAKGTGLLSKWSAVGASDCPASAAGPAQ